MAVMKKARKTRNITFDIVNSPFTVSSHPDIFKSTVHSYGSSNVYYVLLQYQSKTEPVVARVKLAHSAMLFTKGYDGLYPQTVPFRLSYW